MIILLLMVDELLAKLVLLLLLIQCFDNTMLLLFDRFSTRWSLEDDLPPRIFVILVLAGIARSVLVLYIIHTHPLALGNLLLLVVQPILVSLLAERFYHAPLLLLDGRLSVHHWLMLDDHAYRMVRIADRIVFDNLLRVMVMGAVVKPGNGDQMIGRHGFDHLHSGRSLGRRVRLIVRRLVVIVHLELGLLLLMLLLLLLLLMMVRWRCGR